MENNTQKSGKAGYIITIIFLLIVIAILSVLFAFKEVIFKTGTQNVCIQDTNTLISNTPVSNTSANESKIAQERLINSVKGYWIATTGDLFLSITDTTDTLGQVTTNFSLTGASGVSSTTCTIDSNKITCSDKVYNYKVQGNYLILSYDNVTRNFAPSNYYQLSKQSKKYYADIMGYSLSDTVPDKLKENPITGEYINNAILGTWKEDHVDESITFELRNGSIVASQVDQLDNKVTLGIPVGLDNEYIEFVDSSSTSNDIYSYSITNGGSHLTLSRGNQYGVLIKEYSKVENSTSLTNKE